MDVKSSPTYQQIYMPIRETRLCIIIDANTPLITKIPISPGSLTLGQFKAHFSLDNKSYKFYFKSHDPEFGTVKEELIDDDSIIPVEDDRGGVVVWIISNDNAQSALFDPQSPYGKSGGDQQVLNRNTQPSCVVANLHLKPFDTLGLTVLYPSDQLDDRNGLLIDKVQPSSVAALSGRLHPGDRVVEINGIDLRGLSASEAVALFKEVVAAKGSIKLVLEKSHRLSRSNSPHLNNLYDRVIYSQKSQSQKTPVTCGFDPATELPPPPIEFDSDPPVPPHRIVLNNQIARGSYSLPRSLTPRSLYATSNLDTFTSSNDFRYPLDSRSVYEPTTPNSLRQVSVALHCGKDTIEKIYATLKADPASLDIKDREWLKVVVKDAFLGSSLVKWLSRNVYGFCNRSEIKRYANRMLSLNLIKSPMSNSAFSEKCYYKLS